MELCWGGEGVGELTGVEGSVGSAPNSSWEEQNIYKNVFQGHLGAISPRDHRAGGREENLGDSTRTLPHPTKSLSWSGLLPVWKVLAGER